MAGWRKTRAGAASWPNTDSRAHSFFARQITLMRSSSPTSREMETGRATGEDLRSSGSPRCTAHHGLDAYIQDAVKRPGSQEK